MLRAAVDLAEAAGLSTRGLYDGLSFDARALPRTKRVSWDEYCVVVERVAVAAGGGEASADLTESAYHQVLPELRALAGALVEPKLFHRFVIDVLNPPYFPAVEHRFEDLGGDRVRIAMRLRPGARRCEAWFWATAGAARGLSRHLGLPSSRAVATEIAPDHGLYELELPASRTVASRVRRATSTVLRQVIDHWSGRIDDERTPPGAQPAAPAGAGAAHPDARIEAAVVRWKLTPRQESVLRHLVRGLSNKEIAAQLECAENTVELHVTHLLRKAGASSRTHLVSRVWAL